MVLLSLLLLASTTPANIVEARRIEVPEIPFERVHGFAAVNGEIYVGGIRGLLRREGSNWASISDQAVKQIVRDGGTIWVLYGNGSVDKIVPKANQLYYDVFDGAVKRPWVSVISLVDDSLQFGSQGGWFVKSGAGFRESYPKEMEGQVVTAIAKAATSTLLGTQNGLYVASAKSVARYGVGAGLIDPWVTAMEASEPGTLVATADGGLMRFSNGKFKAISCPAKKIRILSRWKGMLVVGALDGCWVKIGDDWNRICDVETTFVEPSDELMLGTPRNIRIFKLR